jgi:glycosyltransferase 2 family protein
MHKLLRRVLVVTLIGVLLYGLFAIYTGISAIGESLATFRSGAFLLALLLATLNYLLRFGKWQYYLARLEIRGIPWLDSLLVFLSGFVLTITPGKVGEVFKSAVLAKTHGVAVERTALIVVADRLTDVIGIVLLILAGSAAFPEGRPWALAGVLAVVVGLVLILWQKPALWLCDRLERGEGKLKSLVPKLRHALASLRVLASPSALGLPTVLSLLAWGAEGLALYVLLVGFQEPATLALSVVVYASATLAGALIPVPGGLGVVESLLQQGLIGFGGVSLGAATASMILVRLATLWWAVLVGFLALLALRWRFPAALREPPRAGAAESGIG